MVTGLLTRRGLLTRKGENEMKVYDMHVHAEYGEPDSNALIERMEASGVYGGTVFSRRPLEAGGEPRADYGERMKNVMEWTKGYEGRLFPVLWIHPYEKNILDKIRDAAESGICAFKMICDSYYVYEPKVMEMLRLIAELKKPVFFHSGILWNGAVSSEYNKPVNWEALLSIPDLQFSMGHCSWPWHDECIALYGKFINAYLENPEVSCEMFFDLTPGTPEIYREDLLYKLFHIGYDVPHNIMFGTDSSAATYGGEWVKKWISFDNMIYDKLGVPEEIRKNIYGDNFLRFIGVKEKNFTHRVQSPDSGVAWRLTDGVS